MIILHTADLHLNSRLETNLDSTRAAKRRNELIRTFEKIVEYAKAEGARAVILAGDLFDESGAPSRTVESVASIIAEAPDVDFLVLLGNHDAANPFSVLETTPPNLKLFGDNWTYFRYEGVTVAGACAPGETMLYDGLEFSEGDYNIAVLHGDINSEIRLSALSGKRIDYLALGHLHAYSAGRIDGRGSYAYAGCPESRGFDEAGVKGICRIDTELHRFTFVTGFSCRTMYELPIDVSDCGGYAEMRRAAMDALDAAGAMEKDMVKIVLRGVCRSESVRDTDQLAADLEGKFYFVKVRDESRMAIRAEEYRNDLSLKGEFVRRVLASGLSEEDCEKIITFGIRAMEKGVKEL